MRMAPQAQGNAQAADAKQDCPVCGREVSTRASDGRIRAHRVGRGVDSWPCPGADPTIGKS